MALIVNKIESRGFEKVRDAIGAILLDELLNQQKLNQTTDEINVFVGRSTPFHQAENLMINVLVGPASFNDKTQSGVKGDYTYYIDVYTAAKQTDTKTGGYKSTILRDKYVRLICAILDDHHYNTLTLKNGLIANVKVDNFQNFEPTDSQDSSFVKMNRITFNVSINECTTLWSGIKINSIFTNVKLCETDKGYQYQII